ncbi:hypothetical protein ACXR0O_25000 [Verrucomicrobiota bacterium sgz303538]
MSRTKNAAEQELPEEEIGPVMNGLQYGKFAQSPWRGIVETALLDLSTRIAELETAIPACPDEKSRLSLESILQAAKDQWHEAALQAGLKLLTVIESGQTESIRELADLVESRTKVPIVEPRRHALLSSYQAVVREKGRLPTIKELQEHPQLQYTGERVLNRWLKGYELELTDCREAQQLEDAWKRVNDATETSDVGKLLGRLRAELATSPRWEKRVPETDDDELLWWLESVGVRFEPAETARSRHGWLFKRLGRTPTADQLLEVLPRYCREALKADAEPDLGSQVLERFCEEQGIAISPPEAVRVTIQVPDNTSSSVS